MLDSLHLPTVATINFDKTHKGHGWIGLRFQLHPDQKPSDFIIHVHLNDQDAKLQQETIGIIGTNLLHSCFTETDPKEILKQLKILKKNCQLIKK